MGPRELPNPDYMSLCLCLVSVVIVFIGGTGLNKPPSCIQEVGGGGGPRDFSASYTGSSNQECKVPCRWGHCNAGISQDTDCDV